MMTTATHGSVPDGSGNVDRVRERCQRLWSVLQQKHRQLSSEQRIEMIPAEFRKIALLLTTEMRLKQEIDSLKQLSIENPSTTFTPRDAPTLRILVKNDVERIIRQLRESSLLLQEELKQCRSDLDVERSIQVEHQQIYELLERQRANQLGEQEAYSPRSREDVLEKDIRNVASENKHYIEHIKQFIHTFYPPPTEEDRRAQRALAGDASDTWGLEETRVVPLVETLETLLILSVSKPDNPYLDTRRGYWPPYTELLLRAGIAAQHPQEPHRIRLYDFGL